MLRSRSARLSDETQEAINCAFQIYRGPRRRERRGVSWNKARMPWCGARPLLEGVPTAKARHRGSESSALFMRSRRAATTPIRNELQIFGMFIERSGGENRNGSCWAETGTALLGQQRERPGPSAVNIDLRGREKGS